MRRGLAIGTASAGMLIAIAATAYHQPFLPSGYGDRREDEVFKDCDACPAMVPIPAGSVVVGDQRRRDYWLSLIGFDPPRRIATIPAFAIGRFEVTFDEWDACVADGGCNGYTPNDEGWGRGDRPVIHVSWHDAQSYVGWLSEKTGQRYRLPSEAEWEHAARAGTRTVYPWGRRASRNFANYGEDEDCDDRCIGAVEGRDAWRNTAPVGRFPPNRFGLFDTSGNAYEWVEDCYVSELPPGLFGAEPVREEPCDERPMKGAAWYSEPWRITSFYRAHSEPENRTWSSSFRVARDL